MPVPPLSMPPLPALPRPLVEEFLVLARGFGADPGHLGEIGQRRALDRLERAEMVEQGALASRADARDLLQSRLADVAAAPDAVRADREAMRLVAQPLDEIERRIARLELERLASRQEEGPHSGAAVPGEPRGVPHGAPAQAARAPTPALVAGVGAAAFGPSVL